MTTSYNATHPPPGPDTSASAQGSPSTPPPTRPGPGNSGGAVFALPEDPQERYFFLAAVSRRFPPDEAKPPRAISDRVQRVLKDSYAADAKKLATAYGQLTDLEDKALRNLPQGLPQSLKESWTKAREGIARAAALLQARARRLQRDFRVETNDIDSDMTPILAKMVYGPQASLQDGSGGNSHPYPASAMVDSAFQRALADADEEVSRLIAEQLPATATLAALGAAVDKESPARDVRAINDQPRARLVSEESLRNGASVATSLTALNEPRLPTGMRDRGWNTLTNERGKIYSFNQEVRDFKDLSAVGGGIHFGGRLVAQGNFKHSVLRYDGATRRLLLVDFGGQLEQPVVSELARIEPSALKALYRYAQSDHNLAISIGWAGANADFGPNEPILLDREFVDTSVGQDLILADGVPWELYEPQSAGWVVPNPIAEAFCTAHKTFTAQRLKSDSELIQAMSPWIEKRTDLSASGRKQAAEHLSPMERYSDPLRYASLRADSREAMVSDLRSLQKDEKIKSAISETVNSELMKRLISEGRFVSRSQQRAAFRRVVDENTDRLWGQFVDRLNKAIAGVEKFPANTKPLDLAAGEYVLHVRNASKVSRNEVEWGAGLFEQTWLPASGERVRRKMAEKYALKPPPSDSGVLAEGILSTLPETTLAVMWDEDSSLSASTTGVVLRNFMTYKYADRYRIFDADREEIRFHDGTDTALTARRLDVLTDVANPALRDGRLGEAFPPLKRVQGYARIVALLRWASREQGRALAGVDFADLIAVASFDSRRTPTPDRIKRSTPPGYKKCS
jgi:hypothetical protein